MIGDTIDDIFRDYINSEKAASLDSYFDKTFRNYIIYTHLRGEQ